MASKSPYSMPIHVTKLSGKIFWGVDKRSKYGELKMGICINVGWNIGGGNSEFEKSKLIPVYSLMIMFYIFVALTNAST